MSKIFFMDSVIVEVSFDDGLNLIEQGYGEYASRKKEPAMMAMLQTVLGHDEIGILAYPTYAEWKHSMGSAVPEHSIVERMQPHDPFSGEAFPDSHQPWTD